MGSAAQLLTPIRSEEACVRATPTFLAVLTLLTGVVCSDEMALAAHALVQDQTASAIVVIERTAAGCEKIGQRFTQPKYFLLYCLTLGP